MNVINQLQLQRKLDHEELLFFVIGLYLFQLCPVIEVFAHQHFLQLLWSEQLHQISVTHLEEASPELMEHILHWCVEGMVHIGIHKLLPVSKFKFHKQIKTSDKLLMKQDWNPIFLTDIFLWNLLCLIFSSTILTFGVPHGLNLGLILFSLISRHYNVR